MFPLLIIHKTCGMSFCHLIVERKNISSQIHSNSHLLFLETKRDFFFCFSSTPLYGSPDHEDVVVHLNFLYHGCHDIFTHSCDHDFNSPLIDISNPPIFDDPYSDEVENPQDFKALQTEMIVISCSHRLEANPTSNQKYVESPYAPHQSPIHIENQSNSHFLHPPPETHDPIAHALESYVASTTAKQNFSSFFMFACLLSSKVCICLSLMQNVTKHHDTSTQCLSRAFNFLISVVVFKI